MAYPNELIECARYLAEHNLGSEPKQAFLRRAVSSAYYAVFHTLTMSAAENWKHERQRERFARLFEHGKMKQASSKVLAQTSPPNPQNAAIAKRLDVVATVFVKLQQARHIADYDSSKVWSRTEVYDNILRGLEAMFAWREIGHTEAAQDHSLDMMGGR